MLGIGLPAGLPPRYGIDPTLACCRTQSVLSGILCGAKEREKTLRSRLQTCSGKIDPTLACCRTQSVQSGILCGAKEREKTLRSRLQTCSGKTCCKPRPARKTQTMVSGNPLRSIPETTDNLLQDAPRPGMHSHAPRGNEKFWSPRFILDADIVPNKNNDYHIHPLLLVRDQIQGVSWHTNAPGVVQKPKPVQDIKSSSLRLSSSFEV